MRRDRRRRHNDRCTAWVVLGAGGIFIGVIVEELQKQRATVNPPPNQSTGTDVIDA